MGDHVIAVFKKNRTTTGSTSSSTFWFSHWQTVETNLFKASVGLYSKPQSVIIIEKRLISFFKKCPAGYHWKEIQNSLLPAASTPMDTRYPSIDLVQCVKFGTPPAVNSRVQWNLFDKMHNNLIHTAGVWRTCKAPKCCPVMGQQDEGAREVVSAFCGPGYDQYYTKELASVMDETEELDRRA